MGWFWADAAPAASLVAPHPLPSDLNARPPPECPMHAGGVAPPPPPPKESGCPIDHSKFSKSSGSAPTPTSAPEPTPAPASSRSTLSKLNPLNYMPFELSQTRAAEQTVDLPVERTLSSIPKGDGEGNWEYPSPQQMYNAMLRKGYTDTPQDAVESMVAVHNFLNEGAWEEIKEWERRFSHGLKQGWQFCKKGEENASQYTTGELAMQPRLVRFMGRPGELTPKAKMMQVMGWLYPSKFGTEPPFDRHDWYIQRITPEGQPQEVRYVIDYYSAPPEPTGEPVFYLDVRPAVDRPSAAIERMMRWGGDVWWRASGGVAREPRS
ncbi:MAG: hypothetical protein M1819_003810 [Sarea resinae]|nr:MAG: hypothetical protein M1819_003810 [Sarea resinae]